MGKKVGTVQKDKKLDFKALWRSFINPEPEELSEEEIILADDTLSEKDKKELLKSLQNNEKLLNKMFRDSYKTTNLKVKNAEISKEQVEKSVSRYKSKNESEKTIGE